MHWPHNPAPSAASESREIRVFLSSTFRDFIEERDLLVKQVFPELRRKARDRGVEVVDVDLRWGLASAITIATTASEFRDRDTRAATNVRALSTELE